MGNSYQFCVHFGFDISRECQKRLQAKTQGNAALLKELRRLVSPQTTVRKDADVIMLMKQYKQTKQR